MIEKDDWRLRGQEEYLQGMKFTYKKFMSVGDRSDHEHCEFCWHKFMEQPEGVEDCTSEGYCSMDGKYWVCESCFEDFKDMFGWEVEKLC